VPKLANHCFGVTTSPGSANSLRPQDPSEGDAGPLATVAYRHKDRCCQKVSWTTSLQQSSTTIAYVNWNSCLFRVRKWNTSWQPFPALARMILEPKPEGETTAIVPTSFLGGSPSDYVSFPGLPKLLLSATHLVDLNLRAIPDSGYISRLPLRIDLA
jgi:hypothetical protein